MKTKDQQVNSEITSKLFVYITTNIVNGKKYIGKCSTGSNTYLGSGTAFNTALKKYGKDNFKREILYYAKSKEDLVEMERFYIFYYNAVKSNRYYNLVDFSIGGSTDKSSYKKVIYQYSTDGQLIREWSSASDACRELGIDRVKIVTAIKKKIRSGGYYWSRINNDVFDVDNCQGAWSRKKVYVFDKVNNIQYTYKSITEAIEKTGLSKGQIYKYYTNDNHPIYKFSISGCEFTPKEKHPPTITDYYQYSLSGEFLRIYSGNEELRRDNHNPTLIQQAINRGMFKSKGFIWNTRPMTSEELIIKRKPYGYYTDGPIIRNRNTRHVLQIKNGIVIGEFKSVGEASRITGLFSSNIYKVCKGERNECGGYYWKYKD